MFIQKSVTAVLTIIVLAKLCREDKPLGIAEWAKYRKEELLKLLCLNWTRMPHHNTYRQILAYKVYEQEVERLVGAYNQCGEQGEVYAMDGKARRGMRKKDEEGYEYCLSVYDVEQAKVLSQVEVGRKENEITKAPQALKSVKISQKVVTGDALHTQRGLAAQILQTQGDYVLPVKENQPQLYKNIQSLFAPDSPKPGFGKIQTDFLTAHKLNKGHGRIETRTITTSEMLNAYVLGRDWLKSIASNGIFNGGVTDVVIAPPTKSNLALPVSPESKPPLYEYCFSDGHIGASRPAYTIAAMSPCRKMLPA
ncbi:MAG: ISAs1 family transposase [Chloroflexota bacterium]